MLGNEHEVVHTHTNDLKWADKGACMKVSCRSVAA